MLLGGAELIQRRIRSGQITGNGTVVLIFQPAEEVGGSRSGARRMLDDGLLERYPYDEVFGIHNGPINKEGVFYFREGAFMFGSDTYEIVIHGASSHGAQPHFAKDASLAMASTIMALHTITSQNVSPLEGTMLSIGIAEAGNSFNVIPDRARIVLSTRSLNSEVATLIERRIREIADTQARAFGCTSEVNKDPGYPCTVNDAGCIAFASAVARDLVGNDRIVMDAEPVPASEDFSLFMQDRPGAFFMIGNGDNGWKDGAPIGRCPVHTPYFDFNDDILPVGAAFWAGLVESKCRQGGGAS
jgi:hippurate hydrolase